MKIPSDENVSEIWKHRDYFGRSDLIEELLLWGLAQRARAMSLEHDWACPTPCIHEDWTDAQWLQAAADELGIKLEEGQVK